MTIEEEIKHLRSVPMFENLDQKKLKLLAFTAERLTFPSGSVLFQQGETGDSAYVILDGEAEVWVSRPEHTPVKVATLARNQIVGEIAMLCGVPRTATVTAKGEVTALKLTRSIFLRLVQDFPEIAVEVLREMALRLERTTQQLREALTDGSS